MGRFQYGVPSTWQLPWLAVEWPWSALVGPLLTLLVQTGMETTPLPCRDTIVGTVRGF